jgi:hypothetical protein
VEPFCDPSRISAVPAVARERLRRRRAERLVPVPCPRPGSDGPDSDDPLSSTPTELAFGAFAFPLAAEPRPPEDLPLEPDAPLR